MTVLRSLLTAAVLHAAAGTAPGLGGPPSVVLRPAEGRAAVTGVSVAPSSVAGGTTVHVHVDGATSVQDFTLDAPHRIVLDLSDAVLTRGVAAGVAAAAGHGGVVGVRTSQFRTGVVRVVVELDRAHAYRVERGDDGVRVVIDGGPAHARAATDTTAHRAAPRPSVPAVDDEPAAIPAPTVAARRTVEARRLTVTYQDADIRDVIAAFAAFSGRTIIAGRDVSGTVTAEIKDQPWDVALRALLGAQGLAATEDRYGIITIDSWRNLATVRSVEPLATQIVDVNYAKASALIPVVQSLLSRDCSTGTSGGPQGGAGPAGQAGGAAAGAPAACLVRGSVTADTATNKLLITDIPSRMNDVLARLRELDVRTPQVAIKARIVFVNRSRLQDIGVSYDLGKGTQQFFNTLVPRTDPSTRVPVFGPDGRVVGLGGGTPYTTGQVALGGNALSALANAATAMKSSALNLIYSLTLGQYQLTAFVNALQQNSLADIQSEPSIVTLNNRTAEIFVGQQVPIRVIDAGAGGSGIGAFPRATVRLEEAGIRLAVTPQVTNNRRIVLDVRAENSNAQTDNSDVGVIFNRQRAENRLLVGDGETAVIGGLTVTQHSRTRSGIPFLSNLPLVGGLFAQTTSSETKQDLLILVTPQILDEGQQPATPMPPLPPRR
ncbi:MAG TPA: AMIN domain-containing protein [Gemmatirosa sp.]